MTMSVAMNRFTEKRCGGSVVAYMVLNGPSSEVKNDPRTRKAYLGL